MNFIESLPGVTSNEFGPIRLFVWRGGNALKNYSSGIAVVSARDEREAWNRLRENNFSAFAQLAYGVGDWVSNSEELAFALDLDDEENRIGWPIRPEEFTLENLPVLVQWGGE